MDNKITKNRLSNFLAYEWILIIIVCVALIFVWEIVYTVGAVRLTAGQKFNFYFDERVDGKTDAVYQVISNDVFSYDVITVTGEQLSGDFNVLTARLAIQEGDILFTTNKQEYTQGEEGSNEVPTAKKVRVKEMIDDIGLYSLEQMLKDGQDYLLQEFFVSGADYTAFNSFNQSNIDKTKVEKVFRERLKNDNRFRKESQILDGIKLEEKRVESLYKNLIDFAKVLALKDTCPELFTIYTKGEQSLAFSTDSDDINRWTSVVNAEKNNGRENQIYAINLGAFTSSQYFDNKTKSNPSKFFTLTGSESAENICVTVFNFKSYQPHLQYETISFINTFIKECSTILD
jgi:hypothetical protein